MVFDCVRYDSITRPERCFHEGPVADFILSGRFGDRAFPAGKAARGEGGSPAGCGGFFVSRF
jgi:hypothetical protein